MGIAAGEYDNVLFRLGRAAISEGVTPLAFHSSNFNAFQPIGGTDASCCALAPRSGSCGTLSANPFLETPVGSPSSYYALITRDEMRLDVTRHITPPFSVSG
ncbi:hypothetical protein CD928_20420 [Sphingopyxis sp. GW247-27LB]|nr:hypothetical protein CD928_20420 [Sphingopyxis sp. GW247-27LB]